MTAYACPMHRDIRAARPVKCEKCGMTLVPEGTRFALLKHMASNPLHLAVMVAAMLALMVAAMMLLH